MLRYGGALLSTGVALWIWFLWPIMHADPLVIFLAAVVFSARFFGFGPAVLCTVTSALIIDYFVLEPRLSFFLTRDDYIRLAIFGVVAVLAAGLARQRSRAETRAQQIHDWMGTIVASSGDAILTKDREGIITSWNRGAEDLYGYSTAEVIGQPVSMLSPPEFSAEIPAFMARLLRGDTIRHHTTERVRKDGSRLIVDLTLSPIYGEKGVIIGASSVARDVTAQRRTEEILRRNEKLATAGRLAAAVSHEINNPLDSISTLIYLAQHHPEKRDEYLRIAQKEIHRVAEIAQQMLGYVREGTSPIDLNVSETLDEVLQLCLRKLEGKRIKVEKVYQNRSQIEGFPGELRQLFSNLILNAVDAMGDGGRLILHVAPSHAWSNGQRRGVRITIADNGSGIRPAELQHIFEPFYTTKKDQGTGLGLWLSHGIVQKHGGYIRVRSRSAPGSSGTVFSVFLPEKTA